MAHRALMAVRLPDSMQIFINDRDVAQYWVDKIVGSGKHVQQAAAGAVSRSTLLNFRTASLDSTVESAASVTKPACAQDLPTVQIKATAACRIQRFFRSRGRQRLQQQLDFKERLIQELVAINKGLASSVEPLKLEVQHLRSQMSSLRGVSSQELGGLGDAVICSSAAAGCTSGLDDCIHAAPDEIDMAEFFGSDGGASTGSFRLAPMTQRGMPVSRNRKSRRKR